MSDYAIINQALSKLGAIFDDDMHGFRSEVWGVIADVIRETRKGREPGAATKELLETMEGALRVSDHNHPKYKYDHDGHVYQVAETAIGLTLIRRFLQEWGR